MRLPSMPSEVCVSFWLVECFVPAGALNVALAEVLRQELLPHGIGVHVYFVSTIASAGYLEEVRGCVFQSVGLVLMSLLAASHL